MIVLSVAALRKPFDQQLVAALACVLIAASTVAPAVYCQTVAAAPVTTGTTTGVDGTLCPIRISTTVESKTATVGCAVEGTLAQSLLMTRTYNAPPGSRVLGHVVEIAGARTQAQAVLSSERRLKTDACLDIVFDEVICPDGQHFRINGKLARQKTVVRLANGHVRTISVNAQGQLIHGKEALSLPVRVRNKVGQNAVGVATLATGGASLLVAPVALGAAGVVSPTFVSNRAVAPEEKHPRLKGFVDGVVDGIPGSFVVQALTKHGEKTGLLPGDELLMSCQPVSGNVLLPAGGQTRVHGVVLSKSTENPGGR